MSSFLMFVTYKKSLFFRGSTSSTYGFNILSLSNVLLNTVKTYQPSNPWYILQMEVPHGFTLACNQHQGINNSSSLIPRVCQNHRIIHHHPCPHRCCRLFCQHLRQHPPPLLRLPQIDVQESPVTVVESDHMVQV